MTVKILKRKDKLHKTITLRVPEALKAELDQLRERSGRGRLRFGGNDERITRKHGTANPVRNGCTRDEPLAQIRRPFGRRNRSQFANGGSPQTDMNDLRMFSARAPRGTRRTCIRGGKEGQVNS